MKVVCTTVIHHTLGEFTHGHIYEIDWSKKKIVYKTKVPKPKADSVFVKLNSRGGNRGGWSVQTTKDVIYVANENTIFTYDHNWNELGRITNQLFTGSHEI